MGKKGADLRGIEQYCTRAKVVDYVTNSGTEKGLVIDQDVTIQLPNGKLITYWERTDNMFDESERGKYFLFMLSIVCIGHEGIESIQPGTYSLDRRYVAGRIEKIIEHDQERDQIILDTKDAFVEFTTRSKLKVNDFIRVSGALVADFKLDRPFTKPGTIIIDKHGDRRIG